MCHFWQTASSHPRNARLLTIHEPGPQPHPPNAAASQLFVMELWLGLGQLPCNAGPTGIEMANSFRPLLGDSPVKQSKNPKLLRLKKERRKKKQQFIFFFSRLFDRRRFSSKDCFTGQSPGMSARTMLAICIPAAPGCA